MMPDHPERDPHPPDLDAGGAVVQVRDGTDGVGQGGDLAQALDHAVDPPRRQFQAVQHGGVQAAGGARRQVRAVGGG